MLQAQTRPEPVAPAAFALRSGDRVVFFGDSITEQKLYSTFVETFVVTRFPALDVRFVHSGWGGDRVGGGGGGPIDLRLARDVLPYQPTVITVMLGMNDGRYVPFNDEIFQTFATGYRHLVRTLRDGAPRARLTLIQPSPYDEVNKPVRDGGSYNDVLLKYGAFVKNLAAQEHQGFADLNTDLVNVLKKAKDKDPEGAAKIVPDRVHPGKSGHLIMAASLLKAWKAPALVAAMDLDGAKAKVSTARNTRITDLARDKDGKLRWTALDGALPMPVDLADAATLLAVSVSDLAATLNQAPLKITGLAKGSYALRIDGEHVAVFTAAEWSKGVNLAMHPTPMMKQAAQVHALTLKHNQLHHDRWRTLQLKLEKDDVPGIDQALVALDTAENQLIVRQHQAARPRSRTFELAPITETSSQIPPGFTPAFGTGTARMVAVSAQKIRNADVVLDLFGDDAAAGLGLVLRGADRMDGVRVSLDAREGGSFGRVESVRAGFGKPSPTPTFAEFWKKGAFNQVQIHIDGDAPHVIVSLNGHTLTDWNGNRGYSQGYQGGDEGAGLFALELPSGEGNTPMPRVRNLAIRDLP